MILLKIKAGLGNQLFEYAYARARALRSNTELKLDLDWYKNRSPKDTPRIYGLSHYNIQASEVQDTEYPIRHNRWFQLYRRIQGKISRDIFKQNDYTYYENKAKPVPKEKTILVEGHFNSEKYFLDFAENIRQELSLKKPLSAEAEKASVEIGELHSSGKMTVLIHVRRGDYLTNQYASSFHGAKGSEYYIQAIERIQEELRLQQAFLKQPTEPSLAYILASDDQDWVRREIVPLLGGNPYILLSRPGIADYEEIHLMSLCQHFIIANSSFSWWGAWLSANPQKLVIAPKNWVHDPSVNTPDVVPTSWIRV